MHNKADKIAVAIVIGIMCVVIMSVGLCLLESLKGYAERQNAYYQQIEDEMIPLGGVEND